MDADICCHTGSMYCAGYCNDDSIICQAGKKEAGSKKKEKEKLKQTLDLQKIYDYNIPVYKKMLKMLTKTVRHKGTCQRAGDGGNPVHVEYARISLLSFSF